MVRLNEKLPCTLICIISKPKLNVSIVKYDSRAFFSVRANQAHTSTSVGEIATKYCFKDLVNEVGVYTDTGSAGEVLRYL